MTPAKIPKKISGERSTNGNSGAVSMGREIEMKIQNVSTSIIVVMGWKIEDGGLESVTVKIGTCYISKMPFQRSRVGKCRAPDPLTPFHYELARIMAQPLHYGWPN